MKKVKDVFVLLCMLAVSMALLFACSNEKVTKDNTQQTTEIKGTIAPTMAVEPTQVAQPTVAVTDTPTDTVIDTEADATDMSGNWSEDMREMRDISSVELVKEIMIGWNLGNTLDATGAETVMSEISWGNPKTTLQLIEEVKEAGFNTLRIPTTWEAHIGPAPEYLIDIDWLNRVQEVVDYGISNDMFVILNSHHEEWYFPSYDNAKKAKDMLEKVWKQIADRFENYDEHLIFEGMNEPRQKGTANEWNGGNAEGWEVINQLNEVFVDTIRSAGGNNALRHLMIPPYAASSSTRAWDTFHMPKDDKVIVSIHAYTPYNFALNKAGTAEWSSSNANDTKEIDSLMTNINDKFLKKGIAVIIGEFGAVDKNGNTAARADWANYYVSKAKEKGIPCVWWDNGAFYGSGELFGLIDRLLYNWHYPEINDALMKGIK